MAKSIQDRIAVLLDHLADPTLSKKQRRDLRNQVKFLEKRPS